jgi:hypothetical protein
VIGIQFTRYRRLPYRRPIWHFLQRHTILDFRLRREASGKSAEPRSVERFAILDCKKLTL